MVAPGTRPRIDIEGYEIIRELHRGGQGVVFLATQRSTKREVAIKVMRQGAFATTADKARFAREIETLGRLDHPNIVVLHDFLTESGTAFTVSIEARRGVTTGISAADRATTVLAAVADNAVVAMIAANFMCVFLHRCYRTLPNRQ